MSASDNDSNLSLNSEETETITNDNHMEITHSINGKVSCVIKIYGKPKIDFAAYEDRIFFYADFKEKEEEEEVEESQ